MQTFLDTNTDTIPPASVAGLRQLLDSTVTQINGFVQDQVTKGTESVVAQTLSSARTSLRDTYMRQLSTIGLLNLTGKTTGDPNVPNAKQIFALPATHTNTLTLIASKERQHDIPHISRIVPALWSGMRVLPPALDHERRRCGRWARDCA